MAINLFSIPVGGTPPPIEAQPPPTEAAAQPSNVDGAPTVIMEQVSRVQAFIVQGDRYRVDTELMDGHKDMAGCGEALEKAYLEIKKEFASKGTVISINPNTRTVTFEPKEGQPVYPEILDDTHPQMNILRGIYKGFTYSDKKQWDTTSWATIPLGSRGDQNGPLPFQRPEQLQSKAFLTLEDLLKEFDNDEKKQQALSTWTLVDKFKDLFRGREQFLGLRKQGIKKEIDELQKQRPYPKDLIAQKTAILDGYEKFETSLMRVDWEALKWALIHPPEKEDEIDAAREGFQALTTAIQKKLGIELDAKTKEYLADAVFLRLQPRDDSRARVLYRTTAPLLQARITKDTVELPLYRFFNAILGQGDLNSAIEHFTFKELFQSLPEDDKVKANFITLGVVLQKIAPNLPAEINIPAKPRLFGKSKYGEQIQEALDKAFDTVMERMRPAPAPQGEPVQEGVLGGAFVQEETYDKDDEKASEVNPVSEGKKSSPVILPDEEGLDEEKLSVDLD